MMRVATLIDLVIIDLISELEVPTCEGAHRVQYHNIAKVRTVYHTMVSNTEYRAHMDKIVFRTGEGDLYITYVVSCDMRHYDVS